MLNSGKKNMAAYLCMIWMSVNTLYAYGDRPQGNPDIIAIQTKAIEELAAKQDIPGLIQMLEIGECASKALAAQHLGYLGDDRALDKLDEMNGQYGGWQAYVSTSLYTNGAFAVAICQIVNKKRSSEEQVSALLELMQGKGPGVPEVVRQYQSPEPIPIKTSSGNVVYHKPWLDYTHISRQVCGRAAQVLAEYDDPRIIPSLRQSKFYEVATIAIGLELRNMKPDDAVKHCLEILQYDPVRQRRNAVFRCLTRLGDEGIKALKDLVDQGYQKPLNLLRYDVKLGDYDQFLSQQLLNNNNAGVRWEAASQLRDYTLNRESLVLVLIDALRDPVLKVRLCAMYGIKMAFMNSKPDTWSDKVVQALMPYFNSTDESVRDSVRKIYEKHHWDSTDKEIIPPALRTDLGRHLNPPSFQSIQNIPQKRILERAAEKSLLYGDPNQAIEPVMPFIFWNHW